MENTPTTIVDAFSAWITSFASMVTDGLVTILPLALPILGALILLAILIRVVQRVTGRRA